ncbi:DNA sulfur modification protein DndD [Kyrpidia spormannii]|uniref:Nuclease SbcCD subunit C n=2 Tax=Kyrpidia spormannii TaxID=2055160 RepID=A0A2K8N6L8_9BACL|nr:DNA sulfur modification protein DndD [Kyrpidia spormannii]
MSEMVIKSITLNNFGVFLGKQTIELYNGRGDGKPVTLIGGLNGCGKTTILDAIFLNLYGKRSPRLPRGESYSDYLRSLISVGIDGKQEESWVELVMEVPDGNDFTALRVRRSWKERQVRVTDRLSVWQDGHLNAYFAEGWDAFIEEQIPVAISELFFFDGERISALAESEETIESLQTAIRSLLGIDTVDRLIKELGTLVRSKERAIKNSDLYEEFKEAHSRLDELDNEIARLNQEQVSLYTRIEQAEKQLEDLEAQYYKLGGNLYEDRERYVTNHQDLTKRSLDLRAEMVALASGALPLTLVRERVERLLLVSRHEELIQKARYILPEIENLQSMLIKQLSTKDEGIQELVNRTIEARYRELSQVANEDINYNLSPAQVQQVLEVISHQTSRSRELIIELDKVETELKQIETNLTLDIDPKQFEFLIEQKTKKKIKIEEYRKEYDNIRSQKARLEAEKRAVETRILHIGNRIAESDDAERIIKYSIKAQEKMRVFRNRLIQQKVGKLAQAITKQYSLLTHKKSLAEEVNVDPVTFRISLKDERSNIIQKSKLSAGERQMLAIAILWGLGKVSGKQLPVIIDTPMGRLDSLHRFNFVSKYLPNASHQVIVLSTDKEIEGDYLRAIEPFINRRYTLVYDELDKSTRIVEGYFNTNSNERESLWHDRETDTIVQ